MTVDPAAPIDTEIARIHLDMLGELRVFPVFVRLGRRSLLDLLPPARELTEQAAAVAIARARDRGEQITCRAACLATAVAPLTASRLSDEALVRRALDHGGRDNVPLS